MNDSFLTHSGRGAIFTFFSRQSRNRAAAWAQLLSNACKRQVMGLADFSVVERGDVHGLHRQAQALPVDQVKQGLINLQVLVLAPQAHGAGLLAVERHERVVPEVGPLIGPQHRLHVAVQTHALEDRRLDGDLGRQRRQRQAAPVDAAAGGLGRRGHQQVAGLRIDGHLQREGLVGEAVLAVAQTAVRQHGAGGALGVAREGARRGRVVLVRPLVRGWVLPPRPFEELMRRLAFSRRVLGGQSARQVRHERFELGRAVDVLLVGELVVEAGQHPIADFGPIAVGLDDRPALGRRHLVLRQGRIPTQDDRPSTTANIRSL